MANALRIRPINEQNDWSFFKNRYPVEESDRQYISALSGDCAMAVWKREIARRWKPLPKFLPATHWANQPIAFGPNWYLQWNAPVDPDPVVAFLRSDLPWADDTDVLVVMDGDTIYTTTWKIFLKYWSTFLFNNEDAILISLSHPRFVHFVETGVLFTGQHEITSTKYIEIDLPEMHEV